MPLFIAYLEILELLEGCNSDGRHLEDEMQSWRKGMRRPKLHIEGEFQGDLPHPNCTGLCRRRDLVARGPRRIGAGSRNASEGGI